MWTAASLVVLGSNQALKDLFFKALNEEMGKEDFIDRVNDAYTKLKENIKPKA